ncbi:MAG: multidrug efflux MFS transporter [Cellulomonas sp.]|nr:multidrug efflux MFS transporter [Cellulomonas sp.]
MTDQPAEQPPAFDRSTIRIVVAVMVGGMAVLLDSTIVAVALKSLAVDLHASVTTIQWVTTAYLLAVGVTMPLAAWAQARWGGRRLWLAGLVLFGVGSVAASMAGSVGVLIAARALQGVGGGILMPLMATLPLQAAKGRVSGRTIAMVSLPMLIGPMLGPVAGGLILHWLSWRWLFWVNVPLIVVGYVLASRALEPERGDRSRQLDVLGVLLLPPGLVGLLYGLSQVSSAGGFGQRRVLVPMLAGLVLVVAFVLHGLRRGPDALVDLRLLARRQVGASAAVMFLAGAGLFAGMFLLPLFWQVSRGQSVLAAGALMVPQGLGSLLARPTSGRLTDTLGSRTVALAGVLIAAAATVPFALAGPGTSTWWLGLALVVRGVGLGGVMIPVMAVAYQGLSADDVAHASVLTRVTQQIGGSFGTAVLAVVLEHGLSTTTTSAAFDRAFWWAVGLSVAAGLVVPTLPKHQRVPDLVQAHDRDVAADAAV